MAKYAEYGGNGSELGEAREQSIMIATMVVNLIMLRTTVRLCD